MDARRRRVLRQHVEVHALLGVEAVPCAVGAAAAQPGRAVPAERVVAVPAERVPAVPFRGDKRAALADLRGRMEADEALRSLLLPGTKVVVGEGDPDAALMFIGEGPGEHESREGRPFVGPAGELLAKMIGAMGLSREAVYITNVVHFRPPHNRAPTPDEVELCRAFWEEQVRVVGPRVIVALGNTAAKVLLETGEGITRLRGRWRRVTMGGVSIPLMPTFHPAFLLRSYTVDNRQKVWNDLQAVMGELGMTGPG